MWLMKVVLPDLSPTEWQRVQENNSWNDVDLRDNRYNLVVHMVSAAKGAEAFYNIGKNVSNKEQDLAHARQLDDAVSEVNIVLALGLYSVL